MAESDKAGEQASDDAPEIPGVDGEQRFVEGLIAVYELGVQFERPKRTGRPRAPGADAKQSGAEQRRAQCMRQ